MASALVVAFSPDGTMLATDAGEPTATREHGTPVRLREVATCRERVQLWHGGTPTEALFSPDGTWLATIDIVEAAFRPDGTRLAAASDDGMARLWAV